MLAEHGAEAEAACLLAGSHKTLLQFKKIDGSLTSSTMAIMKSHAHWLQSVWQGDEDKGPPQPACNCNGGGSTGCMLWEP